MLDVYPTTGDALVTRKPALLASRDVMPRDINAVSEGLTAPGYVASVTEEAAFVRFLGRLTGRVPRSHVPGPGAQANPRESLVTGQTVMARVTGVDVARGRVALSLRPSLCAAATTAAPLLASLCRDLHLAAALQERRGGAGDQGGVPLQVRGKGAGRTWLRWTCNSGCMLTILYRYDNTHRPLPHRVLLTLSFAFLYPLPSTLPCTLPADLLEWPPAPGVPGDRHGG